MSVSVTCDFCDRVVGDFAPPIEFSDDQGTIIKVTIGRGEASPDICQLCLADLFLSLACQVAPKNVTYKRIKE